MDGLSLTPTSLLLPCPPFAFPRLRMPSPSPSAARQAARSQWSGVDWSIGQNLGCKSCPAGDLLWGCTCVPQQPSTTLPPSLCGSTELECLCQEQDEVVGYCVGVLLWSNTCARGMLQARVQRLLYGKPSPLEHSLCVALSLQSLLKSISSPLDLKWSRKSPVLTLSQKDPEWNFLTPAMSWPGACARMLLLPCQQPSCRN